MADHVGKTKDAGWEIGVSRTLPHEPEALWDFVTGAEGLPLWLGSGVALPHERGATYRTSDGTAGEVRSYHHGTRLRMTWQPKSWTHDSVVQVTVSSAARGATLRFHQEHLVDANERERQRAHWMAAMDRVEAALEGSPPG